MTYVLLIVFATSSTYGGVGTIQQEFSTWTNCEAARVALIKAHNGKSVTVNAQGCFKK